MTSLAEAMRTNQNAGAASYGRNAARKHLIGHTAPPVDSFQYQILVCWGFFIASAMHRDAVKKKCVLANVCKIFDFFRDERPSKKMSFS